MRLGRCWEDVKTYIWDDWGRGEGEKYVQDQI